MTYVGRIYRMPRMCKWTRRHNQTKQKSLNVYTRETNESLCETRADRIYIDKNFNSSNALNLHYIDNSLRLWRLRAFRFVYVVCTALTPLSVDKIVSSFNHRVLCARIALPHYIVYVQLVDLQFSEIGQSIECQRMDVSDIVTAQASTSRKLNEKI